MAKLPRTECFRTEKEYGNWFQVSSERSTRTQER